MSTEDAQRRRKASAYYTGMQRRIWQMEDFHPEESAKHIRRLVLIGEDFVTWANRQREGDGFVPALKAKQADRVDMGQRHAFYKRAQRASGYIEALCSFRDPRVIHTEAYRTFIHPYPDIPPPERSNFAIDADSTTLIR